MTSVRVRVLKDCLEYFNVLLVENTQCGSNGGQPQSNINNHLPSQSHSLIYSQSQSHSVRVKIAVAAINPYSPEVYERKSFNDIYFKQYHYQCSLI